MSTATESRELVGFLAIDVLGPNPVALAVHGLFLLYLVVTRSRFR